MIKIILEENSLPMLIPEKLAKKYNVFPVEFQDDNLVVEIEDEDIYALQDLRLATGKEIILKKEKKELISEKIEKYYNSFELDEDYAKKLFENLLEKAIKENASDIHIEPFKEHLIVRMRVDGELKEVSKFLVDVYPSLSTVVKLKASMDITEKRLPQDGRVDIKLGGNLIDIRVSSIPTVYGEKIVLRILNRDTFLKDKLELGFSEEAIKSINHIINKRAGILLVTGPTGSGKTTTVYSLLNDLKGINKNIMTIENPVEYKMDGISQIQVNSKVGLSFDVGLRAILRQDPDIIMVGEIRDAETAKIAVRAAITGHLVISTLHTNDAVSSIARLLEMQIPPYLLNASLIGVISQKLVRKVCNHCSHEIMIKDNFSGDVNTKVAVGCEKCNDKGYFGRTAIYEILEINDDIKTCIRNMEDSSTIKDVAQNNGMITFEDSCKRLINEKITTLEECLVVNEMI
ncbi:TPA: type II/IV secretion system protein [Clostridioides difficile]|uniref:GspE/PulE family protein n=1 Tax=Clostridioides difficile TaxID=1496 RepID=UPI0018D24092|nr:GspE/PulE family protein [Clostridioides difficile]UWD41240.1 GspE/PulE family protein [Clostridioides difficile]HBE9437724.1 type II/IV secretion system protein [Clostridioides difficile]HBF4437208.1 type II/IV secretion system protein [Clostridioides difficile]HBF4771209.1 type II/IV secretion system protein [Clostridioides difficile]HBF5036145.1 type II/IV secretion system protein [Clostridioides difficile]